MVRPVVLWSCVIALALLGVTAAVMRAIHIDDLGSRAEPLRRDVLRSLGRTDGSINRAQDVAAFDASYAAHPVVTLLHVIPGGLFLALAPLQFVARIRNRHRRVHRVLGWMLVVSAGISGVCGLLFGLAWPFGGFAETAIVVIVGILLLYALVRAVTAIRRGDVDMHRRWMIRAFAVILGVSTSRVLGLLFEIASAPHAPDVRILFVAALWGGWIVAIAAGEWWIRGTATAR